MRNRKPEHNVNSPPLPPGPSNAELCNLKQLTTIKYKNTCLHIEMAIALGQQAFSAFSPEIALNLT